MKKSSKIGEGIEEIIQLLDSMTEEAMIEKDFDLIQTLNERKLINNFRLALIYWRHKQDPRPFLEKVVNLAQEMHEFLLHVNRDKSSHVQYADTLALYSAYFLGLSYSPLSLEELYHTLASAFFGNVLIGAADIADWPKYRDAIPAESRYDLARRSNELYADLLAGRISPEKGVPLGEKLWEEREDNDYFQGGGSGGGNENHQIVDYQLGAILKKIGSTVPTIHAWAW